MDTVASDPPLSPRRSSRRLWRLVVLLFATPALLVGGLLGYVWLREHSWTPPAIAEPSPMPDGYARRVALPPRERYRQVLSWQTDVAKEWRKPLSQRHTPLTAGRRWAVRQLDAHQATCANLSGRTANDRLLLANLALRAYRADRGRYPDRLSDLVPTYLRQVPEDPMDGASLRYRRDGDGCLCWSVGPDFKDDGGRRIEHNGKRSPADGLSAKCGDVGDIVSP